ncbi:MAG TPA: glycosyltransferase family 9 protein [Egibacteraceae bacterium]|nr:glycosyltransferase family 9 protein [Egibacteraceae bacterium]
MSHVLVVRLDNAGDVLLTGPAVRAVAAGAQRVTLLCGPAGSAAGRLLPGVDHIEVYRAGWIDPDPPLLDSYAALTLAGSLGARGIDRALVFTSFHQSALPTALLLRLAGISEIAAYSDDYAGSLLDVRHRIDPDVHEVERALSLAASFGYTLPDGDDDRMRVDVGGAGAALRPAEPYVVVHPGASVPARAWAPERYTRLVDALARSGRAVVVTGTPDEATLTARVSGPSRPGVTDLGGRTDLAELGGLMAGADAVVVGNTGPAHLAAAVGTPVASLYAPTVPAVRWRPWRVPHALLHRDVACAGCRARECPVPAHPCIDGVDVAEVLDAVDALGGRGLAVSGQGGKGVR